VRRSFTDGGGEFERVPIPPFFFRFFRLTVNTDDIIIPNSNVNILKQMKVIRSTLDEYRYYY